MSVSAERSEAARILIRVEHGAFASRLLGGLSRPGARSRVLGVLRDLRLLDAALGGASRRPLDRLDPEVLTALRIGLFETVGLGVPHAVATDAAVHLVRRLGKGSAAGLVNAVLRRSADNYRRLAETAPPDLLHSHPVWLYRRWVAQFGEAPAVGMMAAAQRPAPLWVWWPDATAREREAAAGLALRPHPWCPGAWRAEGPAAPLAAAVAAGEAVAQDPASQLVAHLAVRLAEDAPAAGLLDLCAAPGGKTALALSRGRWRLVAAADLRPVRARLLAKKVRSLGERAPVVVADALRPPFAPASWEVVLLDAPCSGTGTLRRHPELRWRLRPEVIPELAARQAAMVEAALPLPAPGGVLVYATCSVEPEENEAVLSAVPTTWHRVDLAPLLPRGTPFLPTPAGGIRLLPGPESDGFTIHALRRGSDEVVRWLGG